jgi:glycosyltransferase involved in cell wall biosynthesis
MPHVKIIMMNDLNITVVIPSYKRAHLLARTIPTYFQEGVKEVILVDDCSPDNTAEVVAQLQQSYPNLRYIRQPRNMKQTAAKNVGIKACTTEWIYFGDDDSILAPHSIAYLYESAQQSHAQMVGAMALYMSEGEENLPIEEVIRRQYQECAPDKLVDIPSLTAHFNMATPRLAEVPFCQACLLMQTRLAAEVLFDEQYLGNAYREETDFIVRCNQHGAKIMYDSRAVQINLPATQATGGARGKSAWKYRYYMIKNTWRFLKKNYPFLKQKYHLKGNAYTVELHYISGFITRPLMRLVHKIV